MFCIPATNAALSSHRFDGFVGSPAMERPTARQSLLWPPAETSVPIAVRSNALEASMSHANCRTRKERARAAMSLEFQAPAMSRPQLVEQNHVARREARGAILKRDGGSDLLPPHRRTVAYVLYRYRAGIGLHVSHTLYGFKAMGSGDYWPLW